MPVIAFEEAECEQCVEEVPRGPRVQAELRAEGFRIGFPLANSVNNPISIALSKVFEAQNPSPICMIRSIVSRKRGRQACCPKD